MVGLIQSMLLEMVESLAGASALADVKRRAEVGEDRVFQMDEDYDDAEFRRLLGAACAVLGVTPSQAEEAFADYFMQDAQKRWPAWFAMCRTAREFLERQPKIHNSFATSVQDPAVRQNIADKFSIGAHASGLRVHYVSSNLLCGLYVALARRIIAHYGESATVEEVRCQKRGDPACEIHIAWPVAGEP